MPSFKKRHNQYEIRFTSTARDGEATESLPLDTPKHVREEVQYEMNLAYRKGHWDPWRQGWKEFRLRSGKVGRSIIELVDYHIEKTIDAGYWKSNNSIQNGESVLYRFAEMAGNYKDVSVLGERHIKQFLRECGEKTKRGELAKSTRNLYLRILKGFYNRLRREKIHDAPVEIKRSRIKDERKKYYTEDQMKALASHFVETEKGTHHALWGYYDKLWILMFYMGLRISEVIGKGKAIRRADYDLKTNMLTVRGKWDKTRVIELLPPARDAFFTLYNQTTNPEDRIVDLSESSLRKNLDKHNEAVFEKHEEARTFTPHSFRHGCATYWLSQGVSVKVLADFLGHENTKVTYGYAKLVPGYVSSEFRQAWENKTAAYTPQVSSDDFKQIQNRDHNG